MTIDAKKRKKNNNGQKQDRLSSLPDHILIDILSLLSLHMAISTSILSRRWQYLWTQITSIHIDIRASKCPFIFWTDFHKKILPQLTSPYLHTFTLGLYCNALGKYKCSIINTWLLQISDCIKIEEIKVICDGFTDQYYFPAIFNISSLVKLEVGRGHDWNLPPVNLPNLRKLSISTYISQCKYFGKLINACFSLEDLSLDIRKDPNYKIDLDVVLLSSPTLKVLKVIIGMYPIEICTMKIEIDAPKLQYLKLHNSDLSKLYFVNKPIMLMEADIKGMGGTSDLSEVISNVRSLVLYHPEIVVKTPLFANLRCLVCNMSNYEDLVQMVELLEKFPALELLTLNLNIWHLESERMRCLLLASFAPNLVPTCLLTHLKRVEMNLMPKYFLKNVATGLIKYMLTNAKVLERLVLKFASGYTSEDEEWHELRVCKEVLDLSRSYSRCKVEFLGQYIKIVQSGEGGKIIRTSKDYIYCI